MTMILTPNYDDEVWPSVSVANTRLLAGVPLSSGNSLLGKFPERLAIFQDDKTIAPDFFYTGSMPVVSQRFANVLEGFDCKLELFELDASKLLGTQRYFFVNLLESVDRLDWAHSEFTERGGFATNITTIWLFDVEAEPPIYRVLKTIPSVIAVSDEASGILKGEKLTGFHLVDCEEWKNPAFGS